MNKKRSGKKEKAEGFKREVEKAFDYIKKGRNYIYFIIGVFAIGALIGFFFPDGFRFFDETLKLLAEKVKDMGALELIRFIFINNATSALFGLVFGFLLGFLPFFSALLNGLVLGYVLNGVQEKAGYGEFWKILPHGIFELPAIFISLGLGLRLGMLIFSKNRKETLKSALWSSIKVYLLIVIPLLVAAAIIEGLLIVHYR